MSDLMHAKCGYRYVRDGQEWEVIGFYSEPCVILQKAGTVFEDVNRVAVIADSIWAEEWTNQ